jgi:hypothetical protein
MPRINTPGRKDFDQQATKPPPIAGLGIPLPMTVFQTKLTPQMTSLKRHHVIAHGALIDA